jgi:outer membrane protein insertion porin family
MYYRSIGAAVGFGKRLQWPDPYFTFYGELGYQRYGLKGWNSFIISDGVANTLSLKLVLQRSSTDSPFYSRTGSEFTLSVQATPPFSAWDGKDYTALKAEGTKEAQQEMYRWIEFHKWLLKGRWFFPLTADQNLVLMLGAEMGYLGHYNKDKVSPFERFEVGGDGMTGYNIYGVDIIALRGYEDGALDQSSYYSVGYNKYTMELRYPVIMKPSSSIYVLGFLEGGNGFNSWKEFSPFKIKRSAGLGVRLYLPIVGMIGVDWGWGFDPAFGQTKRSGSQFHFVLGQQF